MTKEERIQRDNILREIKNGREPRISRRGSALSRPPMMYKVKPNYNPRFKRRKKLTKWQFLIKKAGEFRMRPTLSEGIFKRKLQELELKYVFQYPFLYNGIGGIVDFFLPKLRLCIEVDGGYHLDEDQQQTDRVKDFVFKKMNKRVLRLTNGQATHISVEQLEQQIGQIVNAGSYNK